MKNIIITCGTSICNEFTIRNPNYLIASQKLDDNSSSFNEIYDSILKSYEGCEDNQLGAEIYTLLKLEKDVDDTIYFYFSETKGGELVKKLFVESNILKDRIGDYTYIFDTIDGFNVKDKNLFKEKAISNFYEKLEKIKSSGDKTIMCPVGGYKALIPYASLYAMVHGWDIKYIYEDSDELMDLPSGALDYFIYQQMIGTNPKLESSLGKKTRYNLSQTLTLATFVTNFKKYGYLNEIDTISEKYLGNNPAFKRSLEVLKKNIDFVGINNDDLLKIKGDLKGLSKSLNKSDEIESQFINDIITEIKDNLGTNTIDGRFSIINWYLEKNRILEVSLILRELFLDIFSQYIFGEVKLKENDPNKVDYRGMLETQVYLFFSPNEKQDKKYLEDEKTLTLTERNKICELYKIVAEYSNRCLLEKAYIESKYIRNKLAHVGEKKKEFYNSIKDIPNFIQVLQDFKNSIFSQ